MIVERARARVVQGDRGVAGAAVDRVGALAGDDGVEAAAGDDRIIAGVERRAVIGVVAADEDDGVAAALRVEGGGGIDGRDDDGVTTCDRAVNSDRATDRVDDIARGINMEGGGRVGLNRHEHEHGCQSVGAWALRRERALVDKSDGLAEAALRCGGDQVIDGVCQVLGIPQSICARDRKGKRDGVLSRPTRNRNCTCWHMSRPRPEI